LATSFGFSSVRFSVMMRTRLSLASMMGDIDQRCRPMTLCRSASEKKLASPTGASISA